MATPLKLSPKILQDEINRFYEQACTILSEHDEFFEGFMFQDVTDYERIHALSADIITLYSIFIDIEPQELYRRPLVAENRDAIYELVPYLLAIDENPEDSERDELANLIMSQVLYCMRFTPEELRRHIRYVALTEMSGSDDDEEEESPEDDEVCCIRYTRGRSQMN